MEAACAYLQASTVDSDVPKTPLLKATGAKTDVTGINGRVQVVGDGKSYRATTERDVTLKPVPSTARP